MKRQERKPDPWMLVREGKLTELTEWLRENVSARSSFDINAIDKLTGKTLLVAAIDAVPTPIRTGVQEDMLYVYAIRLLCEAYEADVAFPCGEKRQTPAHRAVLKRNLDVLRYVVCNRKSPFNKDADGLDPYQLAKKLGFTDCVKLLEKEMEKRSQESSPLFAKSAENLRETRAPTESAIKAPQTPTVVRDRNQRTPRRYMSNINRHQSNSQESETLWNRKKRVSERGIRSSSMMKALESVRQHRSKSPGDHHVFRTVEEKGPEELKNSFITTSCSIKQVPPIIHQELAEFNSLCPSGKDVSFFQIRDIQTQGAPIGYLIRIKGLLPYIIRGNTYYGPVVVLGYYPSVLYERGETDTSDSPSFPTASNSGGGGKGVMIDVDGKGVPLSFFRLHKVSTSDRDFRTAFFPRFRAFLDRTNLNKFFFNARASVYLDPLSGALLPSPSDHMFACLSLYVKYVVIRCFEAIPPMVVQESSAALPEFIPFSPNFEWDMRGDPSNQPKKNSNSSLPYIFFPVLRMCFHPVTNYCSSSPVPLKSRSGFPVLETYLYPHPSPEPICFLSPISGEQFLPAKSMIEEYENKPIPPPPMSMLLPFSFSRHPFYTSFLEGEENSSTERQHHSAGGLQCSEVVENQLGSSAFDLLRSYQIHRDLSSFANGMFTYTMETQTVEGHLPIMGTRPKSVLVSDVTDIEDFVLTSMESSISRTSTTESSTTLKGHSNAGAASPINRCRNTLGSASYVASNVASNSTSQPKTTAVYKIEVENVERLCNFRVRIEFKHNTPSNTSGGKGVVYTDSSSFDFPPRIFFPDAALPSGSSPSSGSLTYKCFENVLLNPQTGELNPVFVLIPPPEKTEDGLNVESSMSSAIALPRKDRSGRSSLQKTGAHGRAATLTSRYVRLLDPPRWREQSRPLLTLLAALRDLVTQLLSHMSTRKGDEQLLKTEPAPEKGRPVGGRRQTTEASKNLNSLDSYFTGPGPGNIASGKGDDGGIDSRATSVASKNTDVPRHQSFDSISQQNCIFCLSESKEIVYKPCFHLASCKRCAAEHCLLELKATNRSLVSHSAAVLTPSSGSAPRASGVDENFSTWKCELCAKSIAGLSEVYI